MRIEYIFLLILSLLPLTYKIWYWQHIFLQQKRLNIHFWKYLVGKQGRKTYFHFWTLLEFPVMLAWILPLLDSNFEYLWYPMFFYFLIMYNIYVIWKILRKKIYYPHINIIFLWIIVISLFFLSISLYFSRSIYILISLILLSIPVILFVCDFIFSLIKKR